MTITGNWPRIKALFTEVIELQPFERNSFLDALSSEPELLSEVRRLIDLEERAGNFWSEPIQQSKPASKGALLEPGHTVAGRYCIERLIGSGGMCGGVYAALDLSDGSRVALKTTSNLREFFTARAVDHANVCRVMECGQDGGVSFLTMELLEGETLEQRLADHGPLSAEAWFDFAAQLCAAVAAIHEVGILHRDLKPANIFITAAGRVVLIDFGVARFTSQSAPAGGFEPAQTTGTLPYMAPESLLGRPATVRSDIYSLGVVLHESLTGELPFENPGSAEPVAALRECLQMDPQQRPQSAGQIRFVPKANEVEFSHRNANRESQPNWYNFQYSCSNPVCLCRRVGGGVPLTPVMPLRGKTCCGCNCRCSGKSPLESLRVGVHRGRKMSRTPCRKSA